MNRTRWKLLIGTLGLSLGGLAAIADVPSRNGIVSCTPGKPHQVARVAQESPPIPVPALKVADVPMSGAPMIPAPAAPDLKLPDVVGPAPVTTAALPPLPTITLSEPVKPQQQPAGQVFELVIPSGVADGTVLLPSKPLDPLVKVKVAGAPTKLEDHLTASPPGSVHVQPVRDFAQPNVYPSTPKPATVLEAPAIPTPVARPFAIGGIPLAQPAPVPVQAVVVAQEIPRIPAEAPSPKPIPPAPTIPSWEPRAQAIPTEAPSEPARNLEKKLKVMLHMGDERPRFEVKDGDDIYLKVISDKVEVKSPSDSGANMSTMRAGGKVTFITPGGEGTCDELSVVPGTGQVVVTGKVTFTYNWGKVETTVSGEKMTFRLGSTPGTTPSSGTQAVPTSYQRVR